MDDVLRALDTASRRLRATREEREAVRTYQSLAGEGETLNALLFAGTGLDDRLSGVAEHLDEMLERSAAPRDLVACRGISAFGSYVPPTGTVDDVRSFLSTSLSPEVAREFATGPEPVLFRLHVPGGAAALWLPPLGWRDLAYEQELLLPRSTVLRYGRRRMEDGMLVVECEVVA